MLFVGLDLGTSSTKGIAVNQAGEIVAAESRSYPLSFPHPGWSEQDPEDWLNAAVEILKGIRSRTQEEIGGIAVAGQMHGLVLLDEEDRVIRPAILWNDGRAKEEAEWLNTEVGVQTLRGYTGNIAFAGFTAPKVMWVKKHEPEYYARIRKVMLPKDYLVYRLSGAFCSDVSDASGTLYFDVAARRWSEEMCRICGVKPEWLGKVYESAQPVGVLKKEYADLLGGGEIKVAAGAGDNAAAAIGMGTVGARKCNLSLGTSGTIFFTEDRFEKDADPALHQFAHADGGWHLMGCMLSAASCNQWWIEKVLKTKEYAKEEQGIQNLGENSVFFLPYLMGERCPYNDPDVRGAFVGLGMDTTREELHQAVLEGVAFGLRDGYELIGKSVADPPREMTICGGGAKSKLWLKIMSNVLNVALYKTKTEEGPAYGAAMLAAVACGRFENVHQAAAEWVQKEQVLSAEKALAAAYEKQYAKYHAIYPVLSRLPR